MSDKVDGAVAEKTTSELLDAFENPKVESGEVDVFGNGTKKWSDTIALQAVSASYEILKVGGAVSPDEVMEMTVRELLEKVTPNKLRLKLEKV